MNNDIIISTIGFFFNIIIIYFIGSFIAWDFNPLNWLLFTTIIGRVVLLILLIINIKANYFDDN